MALRLIYQMFTKLLGWIVLRTRSDTTKDIETWCYATNSPYSNDARAATDELDRPRIARRPHPDCYRSTDAADPAVQRSPRAFAIWCCGWIGWPTRSPDER